MNVWIIEMMIKGELEYVIFELESHFKNKKNWIKKGSKKTVEKRLNIKLKKGIFKYEIDDDDLLFFDLPF